MTPITTSPLNFAYKCAEDNGTKVFRWVRAVNPPTDNSTIPDGGSCFQCIFDLVNPGERVIDSALVAGGYVFFTTFVPKTGPCDAGGDAYLYVLDYMCRPLTNASGIILQGSTSINFYDPKSKSWTSGAPSLVGAVQVALGQGMPSRPVLDSSGTSVFIQTSDARLIRIGVDLGEGLKSKVHGWTRED